MNEIDKIVFADTIKNPVTKTKQKPIASSAGTYENHKAAPDKSVNISKSSINPYEEEESYENPANISKAPGCQDDYIDIRSEYANAGAAVNLSMANASVDEAIIQISNL